MAAIQSIAHPSIHIWRLVLPRQIIGLAFPHHSRLAVLTGSKLDPYQVCQCCFCLCPFLQGALESNTKAYLFSPSRTFHRGACATNSAQRQTLLGKSVLKESRGVAEAEAERECFPFPSLSLDLGATRAAGGIIPSRLWAPPPTPPGSRFHLTRGNRSRLACPAATAVVGHETRFSVWAAAFAPLRLMGWLVTFIFDLRGST